MQIAASAGLIFLSFPAYSLLCTLLLAYIIRIGIHVGPLVDKATLHFGTILSYNTSRDFSMKMIIGNYPRASLVLSQERAGKEICARD